VRAKGKIWPIVPFAFNARELTVAAIA